MKFTTFLLPFLMMVPAGATSCSVSYYVYPSGTYDPNGGTLLSNEGDIATPPCSANIEARVTGCTVSGSVTIKLTKHNNNHALVKEHGENNAPYFLYGDSGGSVKDGSIPSPGSYHIKTRVNGLWIGELHFHFTGACCYTCTPPASPVPPTAPTTTAPTTTAPTTTAPTTTAPTPTAPTTTAPTTTAPTTTAPTTTAPTPTAPTPTPPPPSCTVTYKLWNPHPANTFYANLGAVVNNPPCEANIEAVVPDVCDAEGTVIIELYKGNNRIVARPEDNDPYFLYGNYGSHSSNLNVLSGTIPGDGDYSIRTRVNGDWTPKIPFEITGLVCP